jgi:hypothetical protein
VIIASTPGPNSETQFSDFGAESEGTDFDEILDLDDYQRKQLVSKRTKSESGWSMGAEESVVKPSLVTKPLVPKLLPSEPRPKENAITFKIIPLLPAAASALHKTNAASDPAAPAEKSPKRDPDLRERWVSSFARTTVPVTPYQSLPAASSASAKTYLSETLTKLKHTVMWGQAPAARPASHANGLEVPKPVGHVQPQSPCRPRLNSTSVEQVSIE